MNTFDVLILAYIPIIWSWDLMRRTEPEYVECNDHDPDDPNWDHADCESCGGTRLQVVDPEPADPVFGSMRDRYYGTAS
jgi:hypothetical protein